MVPVFFCHIPNYPIRNAMASVCRARWEMEPGIALRSLSPRGLRVGNKEFQRSRRIYADENSLSDIYLVVDDDCLLEKQVPLSGESAVSQAVEVLRRHEEFAVLSFWPTNSTLMPWAAADFPGYEVHEDEEVMEHVSAGGIRVCRKGVVKEWPPIVGRTYDALHAEAIREAGYRIGYFKDLYMNHLGRWYSTAWDGGV